MPRITPACPRNRSVTLSTVATARAKQHEAAVCRVADALGRQFSWFLDPVRLNARADDMRILQRYRLHDPGLIVVSLVLSCFMRSSDTEGRFRDARAIYESMGGPPAKEAAFRFRARDCADLLWSLVKERLSAIAAEVEPRELSGRLKRFHNVLIPDGSSFKLAQALSAVLPGTTTGSASLKLHAVYSLRAGTLESADWTAGTEHDNAHFAPDWQEGVLYLWDLGYNDYARVLDAQAHGAHVLQRLKDGANPRVLASWSDGKVTRKGMRDEDGKPRTLWDVSAEGEPLCHDGVVDLDVELRGKGGRRGTVRVVCVPFEGKDHWYLTTLAREHFTPHDLAEIYAVRWEVELLFRDLNGGTRRDEVVRISNLESLRVVTYATLLAHLLSRDVVDTANHVEQQGPQPIAAAANIAAVAASPP